MAEQVKVQVMQKCVRDKLKVGIFYWMNMTRSHPKNSYSGFQEIQGSCPKLICLLTSTQFRFKILIKISTVYIFMSISLIIKLIYSSGQYLHISVSSFRICFLDIEQWPKNCGPQAGCAPLLAFIRPLRHYSIH